MKKKRMEIHSNQNSKQSLKKKNAKTEPAGKNTKLKQLEKKRKELY